MGEFFKVIFTAVFGLSALGAFMVGTTLLNSIWNCSTYPAETKVIAATCYIKAEDGRWVTFDSYVSVKNLNATVK